MPQSPQSFEKHAKMVPLYHYWAGLFLLVPTVYVAYVTVTSFSWGSLMMLVFAIGVILVAFFARAFPLGVQDRVIRLEERMRIGTLPEDLRGRVDEISTDQLIALRFAPDDELALLVRRILEGEITTRKSIKAAIRTWRADHERI